MASRGANSRYAIVRSIKDNVSESDEAFYINLSNPSAGFSISKPSGTATILNDDSAMIQGNGTVQNPSSKYKILDYQIAPNPARDFIYIHTNFFPEGGAIKLYNNQGIVVRQKGLLSTSEKISISDLPAGIYFLQLNEGGQMVSQKVIIE